MASSLIVPQKSFDFWGPELRLKAIGWRLKEERMFKDLKKGGLRIISLFFLVGLVFFITNLVPQKIARFFGAPVAEARAEVKIGYVDLGKALNDSKRGKEAKAELEAFVKQKQSQIDELEKKINTQKTEFDKQAPALTEQARQERQTQIERLIQDYQKLVQDAQAEVEKKRRDLTTGILKELKDIIDEIGKKEGYTIILESSEGLILYSKEGLDLTGRVIKIYDEKQKK